MLMHQRNKRVTLPLHLRRKLLSEPNPSCRGTWLSPNSSQRGGTEREMPEGRGWGCEGPPSEAALLMPTAFLFLPKAI